MARCEETGLFFLFPCNLPIKLYVLTNEMNDDQAATEIAKWPYEFPLSPDFPHSRERGSVRGRLLVHDGGPPRPARSAYVVLAPPGAAGSWQDNYKVNNNGSTFILWSNPDLLNIRENVLPAK